MIKNEPTCEMRSAGIVMDLDLIKALDDLRDLMADDGVPPSRSEIARTLLWSAVALVRSQDPRVGNLLRLINDAGPISRLA